MLIMEDLCSKQLTVADFVLNSVDILRVKVLKLIVQSWNKFKKTILQENVVYNILQG